MRNTAELPDAGHRYQTPDALVLFSTGRCNAHCGHCFYAAHLNRNDDAISVPVLNKIVASLTRSTSITLTGGEPFSRADFADQLDTVLQAPRVQSVSINSNGFMPDRVRSVLTRMLQRHAKPLRIQLSLDGEEAVHDRIRGVPGGFRKTLETAEWIKAQSAVWPNLAATLSITVMQSNIDGVEPLIELLQSRGLRSKVTFVRGNSFSTFDVPAAISNQEYESEEEPAAIAALTTLIDRIQARFPGYLGEYGRRKLEAAIYTLTHKARPLPCLAGDRDGVVYHDGHVGICEQVVPFGHLADWNWDLGRAWNSAAANDHRRQLTQCACIHGCNLSTAVAHAMQMEQAGN